MATMDDFERLALLKDLAGAKVYEERKAESQRIMKESGVNSRCAPRATNSLSCGADKKRKEIEQQYNYISDRLKELEEEKEDLKKYQSLDKQRRSLEYALWDKEVRDSNSKVEEVTHGDTVCLPFLPYLASHFTDGE